MEKWNSDLLFGGLEGKEKVEALGRLLRWSCAEAIRKGWRVLPGVTYRRPEPGVPPCCCPIGSLVVSFGIPPEAVRTPSFGTVDMSLVGRKVGLTCSEVNAFATGFDNPDMVCWTSLPDYTELGRALRREHAVPA